MSSNKHFELRVVRLIDELYEVIENASSVPLVGKHMIDQDDVIEILDKIKDTLPNEYKEVQLIIAKESDIVGAAEMQHEQMISEAKQRSEAMLENAEVRSREMLMEAQEQSESLTNEHHVATMAADIAQERVIEENQKAAAIMANAYEYADNLLMNLYDNVREVGLTLEANVKEMKKYR